ncbi:MAG: methyltransferase domain-containing protein [Solirubrobacteraceae bacterium]
MSARALDRLPAVDLYGAELLRSASQPDSTGTLRVVDEHGGELPFALRRYLDAPTAEEHRVLLRAVGPVLDIGCGPGRHIVALSRRGVVAVGVDISPLAVRLARTRGANVIEGSIFDRLPGAGTWGSALLLDGNIGIGGAPCRLLARVGALLEPAGIVLVEVEGPDAPTVALRVRLESERTRSDWFPWARMSTADLPAIASGAGFEVREQWRAGGRWFAALERPGRTE